MHEFGDGPAGVFVHGSFGWGLETFPGQRELADSFRIVLADRGGYNKAPAGAVIGWPADASDLLAALADYGGAHLVGQSYGAVVALVAAGRRPDLVRSLVVIEPPLYGIAADSPAVKPILAALNKVIEAAPAMSAGSFAHTYATTVMSLSLDEARAWTAHGDPPTGPRPTAHAVRSAPPVPPSISVHSPPCASARSWWSAAGASHDPLADPLPASHSGSLPSGCPRRSGPIPPCSNTPRTTRR